jgi:hypothetical protein
MENDIIKHGGVFCFLTGVFIALKITGQISWPLLWIFSPLWIPAAIVSIFIVAMAILAFIIK